MADHIDILIQTALFADTDEEKNTARTAIRSLAQQENILTSSTHTLYAAFADGKITGCTIPAFNLRTLTYDMARIIFQVMREHRMGACIFEIARSELSYTNQTYDDVAVCVLAAGVKEHYAGKLFLQADHVQFSRTKFIENKTAELESVKGLIQNAIQAGFYNIDIDASTLVDLSQEDILEQQKNNARITEELTSFSREHQPAGMTITLGGEIGHIGDRNSTVADFEAFMQLYKKKLSVPGITKVSVQTGTSHGGVVAPDGSIQKATVDFSVLQSIGKIARERFHMGGVVQHGASTLPLTLFTEFPKSHTTEIHLSTAFQNIIYDTIPESLRKTMYAWIDENCANERKPEWTEQQFYYKLRKKALGPFKKTLFTLSEQDKQPILNALTQQIEEICRALGMDNTQDIFQPFL